MLEQAINHNFSLLSKTIKITTRINEDVHTIKIVQFKFLYLFTRLRLCGIR